MTDLSANGTVAAQFNTAAAAPTGPSIQQMLQQLGYNVGRNGERLQEATAQFGTDHAGQSDDAKIRAFYTAAQDMQKKLKKEAPGISLAQTNAIMVASASTHVPEDAFAKLGQSQRVFDPTFRRSANYQPGMIQMSEQAWIDSVRKYGSQFPRTQDVAAELNEPGPNGKPRTIAQLPQDLKNEVLALRDDNVASAQIGAEYAKNNPVQLDTMRAWKGTSGHNDAARLDSLFASGGIRGFDPRAMHSVTETDSKGRPRTVMHEDHPWCAAMMNSVNQAAGIPQSNGGSPEWSGDFQHWGNAVDPKKGGHVKPGDVVMFRRDGEFYHVAMVESVDEKNGTFTWIGGNQGNTGAGVNGQGHVTESRDSEPAASLRSQNVVFREPPPNSFARAEATYQAAQLRQQSAPATATPKPNS